MNTLKILAFSLVVIIQPLPILLADEEPEYPSEEGDKCHRTRQSLSTLHTLFEQPSSSDRTRSLWEAFSNVEKNIKTKPMCDDGDTAQGISDETMKLIDSTWESIDQVVLTPAVVELAIKHLDLTGDDDVACSIVKRRENDPSIKTGSFRDRAAAELKSIWGCLSKK